MKCGHGKSLKEPCLVCAKMFAAEDRARALVAEMLAVLRSIRPGVAGEIDRGGGIFSDKQLAAIDASLAKGKS